MPSVNRRHFVRAGLSSLFTPAVAVASATAPRSAPLAWDYFFFDDRFAEARRLADALSGAVTATPVHGDVTSLWTGELARVSVVTPMTMQGVTTESFFFCLKTLLADQVRVDAQVCRIDRDLHLWTMRTGNHFKNGTVSWQSHSRPV
jgi:hypothetical protein